MFPDSHQLDLEFEFSFEDLYRREGLVRLDTTFLEELQRADATLFQRLTNARANPAALDRKQRSELIVELARHLEDFVGQLFGIGSEVNEINPGATL